MDLYEHIYLARQDISQQQAEALADQFKHIVTSRGGTVHKVEYWGVKTLAYRIKKNRKAHFTLLNIEAPPAAIAEMERQESLNEDILRTLTMKVESLENGPSAALRKEDERKARKRSVTGSIKLDPAFDEDVVAKKIAQKLDEINKTIEASLGGG